MISLRQIVWPVSPYPAGACSGIVCLSLDCTADVVGLSAVLFAALYCSLGWGKVRTGCRQTSVLLT